MAASGALPRLDFGRMDIAISLADIDWTDRRYFFTEMDFE
jgi:hypothetical protein